jgi:membrane protein implicated in regulation of membrane protease activity
MDWLTGSLEHMTAWHWLGLGIFLLVLEIGLATFDLLWVAVAAFATALFAAVLPIVGWPGELSFFGAVATVLVVLGRTKFKGLRKPASDHPLLNDRTAKMVGRHGEAAATFEGGEGRVRIGDTVWAAMQADGRAISIGDEVVVAGAEGTKLKVKPV